VKHFVLFTHLVADNVDEWTFIRDSTYRAAANTLGFKHHVHRDWFVENNLAATQLLDELHHKHLAWINDTNSVDKEASYEQARQMVQRELRLMKDSWWAGIASELEAAVDKHDMSSFCHNFKKVFGSPKEAGTMPVFSKNGTTLLTRQSDMMNRWVEHFNTILNQPSSFDASVLLEISQRPTDASLAVLPSLHEVHCAIKSLTNGKAPGANCIPPEVLKCGRMPLVHRLEHLFSVIWHEEAVPQEFKDASIVHLHKRNGVRTNCDSHRRIPILSEGGKISGTHHVNQTVRLRGIYWHTS